MEPQPLAEDVDAESTLRTDATVQQVVSRVTARLQGAPVPDVERALQDELKAAGLPEQPAPWVASTSNEIAAGRSVVVDARAEVDPDEQPRG